MRSAASLAPLLCLLGVEFLALENESNLQERRGLRSVPGEPLGRSGRLHHRSELSEAPPAAGALCPCPIALEMLSG